MKVQVTAGGIYDAKGQEIPVGSELTIDAIPAELVGRVTPLGGSPVAVPVEPSQGGAPYEVKESSPGWYQVYDAAGAEVGKKLRKDDAEAFTALSDEDKAEFLKGEA